MTAVLVCTHGNSAAELVNSAEMICGNQSNWGTVSFKIGMDPDQLMASISNQIVKLNRASGLLCLTDLKGGTPFNVLVRLSENEDLEIITGVNIPMLVEAAMSPQNISAADLSEKLLSVGKESIFLYCKDKIQSNDLEEDF